VNTDGPGRLLDHSFRLSPDPSVDPRPVGTEGFVFSLSNPVIYLHHARVAFAVERHREGTVVGRFFSTDGVQPQHIFVRNWFQVSDKRSRKDAFYVVLP